MNDPDQRYIYGLDQKPQRYVMGIKYDKFTRYYFNPPSWFIPKIIFEFYRKYKYYKAFGTAPRYEDQSEKFLFLWQEYERAYNEAIVEKGK